MRTATRVGDLGRVEGPVGVVMGGRGRTQDGRTARGGDPEEGDPGGMWGHNWGSLWGGVELGDGHRVGGCLGGRELWAMWARGRSRRKRTSQEWEAQERASPVPSSFTMPSPSALFCLSKALRSRTLGERKDGADGLRPLPHSSRAPQAPPSPPTHPVWAESHGKACMS